MPRTKRSEDELRAASEHLFYEWWMLQFTADQLLSGNHRDARLLNALLEALVIHYRSLLDFFYPGEHPRPDDMIAHDYFDEPKQWEQVRLEPPTTLTAERTRAHKEIAHLTYARLDVTPDAKGWNHVQIRRHFEAIFAIFVHHVPTARLDSAWVEYTSRKAA